MERSFFVKCRKLPRRSPNSDDNALHFKVCGDRRSQFEMDAEVMRSPDRRAMHVSELTDEDLAALDAMEIPAEGARYDHEMT
jgi:hypothetical protein